MAYAIEWDDHNERYYQHGLDRGVAYISGVGAVPWNGLTSFEEGTEQAQSSVLYRDGEIYLADMDASDFGGTLAAIFYPEEMAECLGIPAATDGLYVDNQKPKRFSFAYRSLIGSGAEGDMFGYQIHLVYNAVASINSRTRKTMGSDNEPMEFGFNLVCTPVRLTGFRPSAHYIIDTRNMSPSVLTSIENLLYGTSSAPTELPLPGVFFDLMNFGSGIDVTLNVAAKTFQVDAASDKITVNMDGTFTVTGINATASDVNGQYVISTGGDTTVV